MFDNVFRIRNANWTLFPSLLEKLFKTSEEKNNEFKRIYGFSITEYLQLINKIYKSIFINNLEPTKLYFNKYSAQENKILSFCSSSNTNISYLLPTDFNKNIFSKKPLIKMKNHYFMVNKSFCSWGFYNTISDLNINQKYIDIGTNIEEIIKEKLFEIPGCRIYSGKYKNSEKIDGECDIVFSDLKYIIFIETKKKTITQNSLTGNNLSDLLFDLSSMIITSQEQATLHEYSIRKDSFIKFENGDVLSFQNQIIYKLSLTLFDLFMFNDHNFTMELIKYLQNIDFHFLNEDDMSKEARKEAISKINIDGVNKKRLKLNETISKLEKMNLSIREDLFYSYFISLEQFLFLIEQTKQTSYSLGKYLEDMKNCSFQLGDFYSEFFEIQKLKN